MTTELENVMGGELIDFDAVADPAPSHDNPTLARMVAAVEEINEHTVRQLVAAAFETLSDAEVAGAYLAADGQPGDPMTDLLCVVAEQRRVNL